MKSFLFYKVWHYSVYRIKPRSLLYPVVPVELLRTSARGSCPYTVAKKDKMLWDYTKFAMIKKGKDWVTPWNHVLQSFFTLLRAIPVCNRLVFKRASYSSPKQRTRKWAVNSAAWTATVCIEYSFKFALYSALEMKLQCLRRRWRSLQ